MYWFLQIAYFKLDRPCVSLLDHILFRFLRAHGCFLFLKHRQVTVESGPVRAFLARRRGHDRPVGCLAWKNGSKDKDKDPGTAELLLLGFLGRVSRCMPYSMSSNLLSFGGHTIG